MSKITLILLTFTLSITSAVTSFAADEQAPAVTPDKPALAPASTPPKETTPAPRFYKPAWGPRTQLLAERAAQGADIAFVGDSITEYWETIGKDAWATHFASRWKCVNLGVAGDHTENVLWRLTKGGNLGTAANRLTPKVFVVLIGTNNASRPEATPEQVFAGVKAVVETLEKASPTSKIILTAIFPRANTESTKPEEVALATNPLLKAYAAEKGLVWFDINAKLAPDGTVTKDIFGDLIHPSAKGYEIWASELEPVLAQITGAPEK
jgi:lysophospholipase L1-like esterase